MVQFSIATPWLWAQWSYQCARGFLWQAVDHMLGVHTTPPQRPSPYVAIDRQVFESKPCGWLSLYRTLRWVRPGPDDVFLDIGSGHGRAVLLASLFPFHRAIGLEISEPLHQAAQQNLSSFRMQYHASVEFIWGDAAVYKVPTDVSIVFMYNPFQGHLFHCCMRQLFDSLDLSPRRLYLIYLSPVEHGFLMGTGRCRIVKRFRGWRPTEEWARMLSTNVYELA